MSRSVIEEIKARSDIVEVIGGYVPLKRSGSSYRALCPFHNEKTPSFHVFPDTGTWRCFGACGTGGDVISFIQKHENMEFRDALRLLGQRVGIDIDRDRNPEEVNRRNQLREINRLAATYYHAQLRNGPAGAEARAYLERREITSETIEMFQLGFALDGWDHLIGYLRERDYSLDDLEAAGLIIRREDGGGYDRFRGRLMIPIRDLQGHVIGFGGRILGNGEPKYLNTSQTALFDKSSVIFAFDLARRSIISQDQVVLVEGYMDVISAHQRGFKNVVAAMGTSVTPAQLQRLRKSTDQFVFALDADAAGISATLRSIHVAREALASAAVPVPTANGRIRYEKRLGAVVKIAAMPPGKDPDDVLREDPDLWRRLIEEATPLVDFYFQQAAAEEDLQTAHGKAEFVKRLLPTINEIDDIIERKHYVAKLATIAGVTEREIDQQLEAYAQSASRARRRSFSPSPPIPPDGDEPLPPEAGSAEPETVPQHPVAKSQEQRIEEQILAYLITSPDLLRQADGELAELNLDPIQIDDFQHAVVRTIFDAHQEFLYSDAASSSEIFAEHIDPTLESYFEFIRLEAESCKTLREEQLLKDLVDSILRLRQLRAEQVTIQLEQRIREEPPEDELRELYAMLKAKSQEKVILMKARASRSHSNRWFNSNQRL